MGDRWWADPGPDEEEQPAPPPMSPFVAKLIAEARAAQDAAQAGSSGAPVHDDWATGGTGAPGPGGDSNEAPGDTSSGAPVHDDWSQPPPDTYTPPVRDDWAQPPHDWGDTNAPPEAPPDTSSGAPVHDDWSQPPADTVEPPVHDDWNQPQRDWGSTNAPPETPSDTFEPPVHDDWATTNEPDTVEPPIRDDWNQPFAEAIGAAPPGWGDTQTTLRDPWATPAEPWGPAGDQPTSTPTATEIPDLPLGDWFAASAEAAGTPNAVSTARARWQATQTAGDRAEATQEARDASAARTATAAAVRDQRQAAGTATAEARREAGVAATETARERGVQLTQTARDRADEVAAARTGTAEARRDAATATAEARAEATAQARGTATAEAQDQARATETSRGTATAQAAEARGTATAEAQARTDAEHAAATATKEARDLPAEQMRQAAQLLKDADALSDSVPKDRVTGRPIPGAPDPGEPLREQARILMNTARQEQGLPPIPPPPPPATPTPAPTQTPVPGWFDWARGATQTPTPQPTMTPFNPDAAPGAPGGLGGPVPLGSGGAVPLGTATPSLPPTTTPTPAVFLDALNPPTAPAPGGAATGPTTTLQTGVTVLPDGTLVDQDGNPVSGAAAPASGARDDWRLDRPMQPQEPPPVLGPVQIPPSPDPGNPLYYPDVETAVLARSPGGQRWPAAVARPPPAAPPRAAGLPDPNALPGDPGAVPPGSTRVPRGGAAAPAPGEPDALPAEALAPNAARPLLPGQGLSPQASAPAVMRHADAVQNAFGDLGDQAVVNALNIVARESSGNPAALNPGTARVPEHSIGLFQINTNAWPQLAAKYDLTDPHQNALAAREVYDAQGWRAWYTNAQILGLPLGRGAGQGASAAATGSTPLRPLAQGAAPVALSAAQDAAMPGAGAPGTAAGLPGAPGALPDIVAQRAALDASMPGAAGALPPDDVGVLRPAGTAATRSGALAGVPRTGTGAAITPGSPPKITGNEAVDNANWLAYMRATDPNFVPPVGAEGPAAAAPRAAAVPREPTNKTKAEPNAAKMVVSPSGYYRLSDGTIKSIAEMRAGLAAAGWGGNTESDQDVLAGYARTTGKTLSPSATAPPPVATPEQRAQVARWTPNILKVNVGTGVPADVILAAIHTISLGDPSHQGGLMGVPAKNLAPGENATDGETSIRVGARLLGSLYGGTKDWATAFRQYLGLMGVPPASMDEILAVFNQERNAYQPAGAAGAPAGPFVPGSLVPTAA